MDILVLMKVVPDVVEELEVGADGKSLDTSFLRTILSERDDHALEQALLLKDKHGGKVTLLTLDAPDIDDVLFTALAKGADRAV
ncbi:MAG: electron transfer flavoprotein subunit beta/FixA family protein, partial [Verrucomicrobia bacterium]|nr:electron transfer flavoprotein subunit beta/FixA family protein [Verrucomicrobiota bacterium]